MSNNAASDKNEASDDVGRHARVQLIDYAKMQHRKRLPQVLKEFHVHKLAAEHALTLVAPEQHPLGTIAGKAVRLAKTDIQPPSTSVDLSEQQLEIAIVARMREYRIRQQSEYGPYTDIDIDELFNPVDRMESFLLNSRKRHYAVNVAIEALASSLMKLVEAEQALLKLINQATQIVQGDHPDWEDVSFDDFDPDTIACRAAMQNWVNHEKFFVEKVQVIRDRLIYIMARKKEFMRTLKERFTAMLQEYSQQQQQHQHYDNSMGFA